MNKITLNYIGILFLVVIASCLIHEFGHYITGVFLGNDMGMNLNRAYPVDGSYAASLHYPVVVSAGPVITILQGIVALVLMYVFGTTKWLYGFLIEPVTLRIWPYLVSPLMSQDEAIVSDHLGMSPWILPIFVWLLLGALAWWGSKKMKVSLKFAFLTILLILVIFQIVLRSNNLVVSLIHN